MNKKIFYTLLLGIGAALTSCEDNLSVIGSDIIGSEVKITVDSAAYDLKGKTIDALPIESRTADNLIGSIKADPYGSLQCSFVSQLLPAESLIIPDSIATEDIHSFKMILRVPRSSVTGDSLAPQQLKVYELTTPLTGSLPAGFPEGCYNPKALGHSNYTLSGLTLGDSAFTKLTRLDITVDLDPQKGRQIVAQYRNDPSLFQWPSRFNSQFPGMYVKSTFGKGCIANVERANYYVYWNRNELRLTTEDDKVVYKDVEVTDSMCVFTTAPEVMSRNLISYTPSSTLTSLRNAGKSLITTPDGYNTQITFPADALLSDFRNGKIGLSVINSMKLIIPASRIANSFNIEPAPSLLMIKKSEASTFFSEGKIPDDKSSFLADYDTDTGRYTFSKLREYILELSQRSEETSLDEEFILIPVLPSYEVVKKSDNTSVTYVTSCIPYSVRPTMTQLHTEAAIIVFTYTNQIL